MSKATKSSTKTIPIYTAIIFAGITFLAGFISAMLLPLAERSFQASGKPDTKDLVEQIRTLEGEAEKSPLDEKLWAELAELYSDSSLFDKAISAYQKTLSINPKNADAWTEIGVLHHKNGKPETAVEALDKAIAIDPRNENSRFNKGFVLMHGLKNREGAIKTWEELLEINPLAMAGKDQSVDQLVRHYKEGHDKK